MTLIGQIQTHPGLVRCADVTTGLCCPPPPPKKKAISLGNLKSKTKVHFQTKALQLDRITLENINLKNYGGFFS